VITVNGEECTGETAEVGIVFVHVAVEEPLTCQIVTPGADGSWTGQPTVLTAADPAAEFLVSAMCFDADSLEPIAFYELVDFDVTEAPTTTTTTTAPPAPTAPAPAAPATPVTAQPKSTG
jgi:hypothetical protein